MHKATITLQALLLERIHELEAQLKKTAESEQAKAAQLARLEGRAAVAEGSLKAAEQQVSQALAELQAQRTKVRRPVKAPAIKKAIVGARLWSIYCWQTLPAGNHSAGFPSPEAVRAASHGQTHTRVCDGASLEDLPQTASRVTTCPATRV